MTASRILLKSSLLNPTTRDKPTRPGIHVFGHIVPLAISGSAHRILWMPPNIMKLKVSWTSLTPYLASGQIIESKNRALTCWDSISGVILICSAFSSSFTLSDYFIRNKSEKVQCEISDCSSLVWAKQLAYTTLGGV